MKVILELDVVKLKARALGPIKFHAFEIEMTFRKLQIFCNRPIFFGVGVGEEDEEEEEEKEGGPTREVCVRPLRTVRTAFRRLAAAGGVPCAEPRRAAPPKAPAAETAWFGDGPPVRAARTVRPRGERVLEHACARGPESYANGTLAHAHAPETPTYAPRRNTNNNNALASARL
jgi:hypothetical protein